MDIGTWQATVHGVTKESDTTEQLNNTPTGAVTPEVDQKGQKVGGNPIPENPCPFLQNSWNNPHSLAYEVTQPIKTKHPIFQSLSPFEMAHTL